jgi:soluble lytic murein transglycosylase-like protein
MDLARLFKKYGDMYSLDPELLISIGIVESNLEPGALGDGGASIGIMQIHRRTWGDFSPPAPPWVDLVDPEKNIKAGAMVLASKVKRHGGDLRRAVIAYNGHRGRFTRAGVGYLRKVARVYYSRTGRALAVPFPYEDPAIIMAAVLALVLVTRPRRSPAPALA